MRDEGEVLETNMNEIVAKTELTGEIRGLWAVQPPIPGYQGVWGLGFLL